MENTMKKRNIRLMVSVAFLASTLSACGTSGGAIPEATKPDINTVKSLVRSLFYNESQAFARSTHEGLQFVYDNNYPGSLISSKAIKCMGDYPEYKSTQVADLSTLMPDPNWVIPAGSSDDNPAIIGTKPKGETYIVTVTETSESYGQSKTVSSDRHVTILDGVAYHFSNICLR